MSRDREYLLFPVGRLVQGSLYEPQTTDAENRPLTVKSGAKQGQPRVDYYFAYAMLKGVEQHWMQTDWGKKIYEIAAAHFKTEIQSPTFAWKIIDGDSAVPNSKGTKPCDREGYAGHWVLSFTGGYAPSLVNADGTPYTLPTNSIACGDYVQVYGSIVDNGSNIKPGVFLNHSHVAFIGYGKRIVFVTIDPKTLAWSKQLPAGASATPLPATFAPPGNIPPPAAMPIPVQAAMPAPYPQILTPPPVAAPVPPQPVKMMTAKAGGATYEAYLASGWTDEQLIQHGYMSA